MNARIVPRSGEKSFQSNEPWDRFFVAEYSDEAFDCNFDVQVRLEEDGRVFLSTGEGHPSTFKLATITLKQFHEIIREFIRGRNRAEIEAFNM